MTKLKFDKHYRHQAAFFKKAYGETLYDYKVQPWHRTYINKIKNHMLKKNRKGTLADLGTGQGYISIEMAKLGLEVIACDISKESIDNINRYKKEFKLPNVKTLRCFAENLPLKDESIDYIVANAILEHISDEKKAINEWKRVLKLGGRMLISVPLKYKYIWPFLWPVNYINDKRVGHLRQYNLETLSQKFKLKVIHHSYTGHLIKVLGALTSLLIKKDIFPEKLEAIDAKGQRKRYGASNLVVVFEK